MNHSLFSHKPLLGAALCASVLVGITSCQDEDFGYNAEQIRYEKEFSKLYGEVPDGKSWDMSSYTNLYDPDSCYAGTQTRGTDFSGTLVEGTHYAVKGWWELPRQTHDWMVDALKEGKDNRYLGSNFVLQLPANDFVIIPIFQGASSINSELEIKINGYMSKSIWKKNQNLLVNDYYSSDAESMPAISSLPIDYNPETISDDTNGYISKYTNGKSDGTFVADNKWHMLGYYTGWQEDDKASNPRERLSSLTLDQIKAMDKEYQNEMYPSSTIKSKRLLSRPIYFRRNSISQVDKGFMYLSLHNTGTAWDMYSGYTKRWDQDTKEWTTIDHRLTSINPEGHMLALNVPSTYRPSASQLPDIHEGAGGDHQKASQVIMVACEDANGTRTDHDVNDVVFLIIGYPNAPTIVPTKETIEKRYMCEDLGGTYDFDFNDIVVDVAQTRYFKINADPSTIEDPTIENIHINDMIIDETKPTVQMATISHLCGTLPIQARVGNYFFPKISDPTDLGQTRRELEGEGILLTSDDGAFTRAQRPVGTVQAPSGWNPNKTRIITDNSWDPNKNNVRIYVEWPEDQNVEWDKDHKNNTNNGNSQHQSLTYLPTDDSDYFADFSAGNYKVVRFPDKYSSGEKKRIPYILATDTNVPWMNEGMHVPEEWIVGNFSAVLPELTKDNPADPGSCLFMERYPDADGEGRIWQGSVTGMANTTGIVFKPGSPEMKAIEESQQGIRGYYLLNVYTEPMRGETGRIGLATLGSNDTWVELANRPDGYMQFPVSDHQGRYKNTSLSDCNGLECTTIYLTPAEWSNIQTNGLVVTSRTDGLVIRKITTSRPCIFNSTTNDDVVRNNGAVVVDNGYTINIVKPQATTVNGKSINGSIRSNESERVAVYKKDDDTYNQGEQERVRIPFETAHFTRYGTVTLTAVGDPGCKFDCWIIDGVENHTIPNEYTFGCPFDKTDKDENPANASITISAKFAEAIDPELQFVDGTNEVDLTLALNGTKPYKVYATSKNMANLLNAFGENSQIVGVDFDTEGTGASAKHVIKLDPKTVGESSFILYQKDGDYNEVGYGVSGELKVNVKVIDQIPNLADDKKLASWMIRKWSDGTANAHIESDELNGKQQLPTGTQITGAWNKHIFSGDDYGSYTYYIDFPDANVLVAEVAEGNPIFNFNQQRGAEDNYPQSTGSRLAVSASQSTQYLTIVDNGANGAKTYIIDLKAIRKESGYLHLTSVNIPDGETAKVNWIKVDNNYSYLRDRWGKMKDMITPTVDGGVTLETTDVYNWNSPYSQTSTIASVPTGNIKDLTAVDHDNLVIYGGADSWPMRAVDLTRATKLVVECDAANTTEIFFQFNKVDWDHGMGSPQIGTSNRDVCAEVRTGDKVYFVVDLDKIRNNEGINYLYLNAINAHAKAQINEIYVDAKNSYGVDQYMSAMTKYEVHAFCHLTNKGEDNATFGYPTYMINSGSMFTKDGSGNYVAVPGNSINNVSKVYVSAGASVTITAPEVSGYNFKWSNGSTDYSRTETINADFTTYADYSYTIAKETELLAANDDQSGWTSLDYTNYTGGHNLGTESSIGDGYGDSNVGTGNFEDLSSYTVLKLVLKSAESGIGPRFVFNKQEDNSLFDIVENGANKEYLHVNHDLEKSNNVTIYYVNLKAIKESQGFVKLNCIKAIWSEDGKKISLYENPAVKDKSL